MAKLEAVHQELETEYNLVRQELRLEKLELKEDQELIVVLKRLKMLLDKLTHSARVDDQQHRYRNMGGNIGGAADWLQNAINHLQTVERLDLRVQREDRKEAAMILKDLAPSDWRSQGELDGMKKYKLIRKEENREEHLEALHLTMLGNVEGEIIGVLNYIRRHLPQEEGSIPESNIKIINAVLIEAEHILSQIRGVFQKERWLLSAEIKHK